MKRTICAAIAAMTISVATAQTYKIDVDKSVLEWTGYAEVGGFSQTGTLNVSEGIMILSDGDLQKLEVTVNVKTITSDEKELESHLKEKDFFFVKKYPEAYLTFSGKEKDQYLFDLTIRGITETVVLPINLDVLEKEYVAKGRVIIDRTKFDIKYNSSSYFQDLGNYAIKNEFELEYNIVFEKI